MAAANRLYSPSENLSSSCTSPSSTTRLMCYDAAGNMIRDKHVTNAAWMSYDGENKMTRYDADDAQTDTTHYLYDADGKRKQTGSLHQVHGLGGELLAEPSGLVMMDYIYRNGDLFFKMNNKSSSARWLVKDHLGTPRIVADISGNLSAVKRHDYLPFGEEIGSTVGGRSTSQGYGNPQSDGVRQQFTGYERDDESGLDFAQARMFSSSLGRFGQCDPVFVSKEHPQSPQRWNLYVYVVNNPLNGTDPDGRKPKPKVIDIFITIAVAERKANGSTRDWNDLGRSAPKGVKVNVYTVDSGTATAERFAESLKSAGRTIIVFGHSVADPAEMKKSTETGSRLKGMGLSFSNGTFQDNVALPDGKMPQYVESVKAGSVALFTCDAGKAPYEIFSRMGGGGQLIANGGGTNGASSVLGQEEAAYAAAETLIKGGSVNDAKNAAQNAINSSKHPEDVDDGMWHLEQKRPE